MTCLPGIQHSVDGVLIRLMKQSTDRKSVFHWFSISDINECESSPCQNSGTCVEGIGMFTCECPGYEGDMCETGRKLGCVPTIPVWCHVVDSMLYRVLIKA